MHTMQIELKKNQKSCLLVTLLSFVLCAGLFCVEYRLGLDYLWQTALKWSLFFLVPFLFFRKSIIIGRFSLRTIQQGIILGLITWGAIYIAYYFLQSHISWDIIQTYLNEKNITATTFIVAFLYVMFWNSFLEEIFFRWWIFNSLYSSNKAFAYIFSAGLFSVYHLVIFLTWFTGPILFIALAWLFIGWLLFAYLYTLNSSIWTAWLVHIFADLVIVFIAFSRFFS